MNKHYNNYSVKYTNFRKISNYSPFLSASKDPIKYPNSKDTSIKTTIEPELKEPSILKKKQFRKNKANHSLLSSHSLLCGLSCNFFAL